MTGPRLRNLVHCGTLEAAGFAFDLALLSEAEARQRILRLWEPGAAVYRVNGALVLRLSAPRLVRSDEAPGTPLVPDSAALGSAANRSGPLDRAATVRERGLGSGADASSGFEVQHRRDPRPTASGALANARGSVPGSATAALLLAAPLDPDEWEQLGAPETGVVLVRGGTALPYELDERRREDPALWLDLSGLTPCEAVSLGRAPAAPETLVRDATFDPRRRLVPLPPLSDEARRVAEALRTGRGRGSGEGLLGAALSGAGMAARSLLQALLRKLPHANPSRPGPRPGVPQPRRPAQPERAPGADLLSRLLWLSRLPQLLGRAHAAYLRKMIELFERGDLREALRHAIPLGGRHDGGPLRPSLGLLGPRADLRIPLFRSGGGSALFVAPDLMEYLRSLYRQAFERAEQAGKIDEAAFILAELLADVEQAVAFLERHGRLREAAELAEARELPPGLVVRQWFVAGDRERAVLLARRMGVFGDAVARLERSASPEARVLRELWAESLALEGDYAAAVEALWPVEAARARVLLWVERALELGGPVGARMLARKASLVPEAYPEIREAAVRLLESDDAETASERLAFAEALRVQRTVPPVRTLARAAARALARDAAATGSPGTVQAAREMLSTAGDAALRADFPLLQARSPAGVRLRSRTEPVRIDFAAGDAGAVPLSDAALLPNGRCLVALGEAGARLLTRDGRTVAHFDQPAHRLVVADAGHHAFAPAPRGGVVRLAKLDLVDRWSESWCEAVLTAWAPDYDGSLWFVGNGRELLGIDATSPRFGTLWRVRDVEGHLRDLRRSAGSLAALIHKAPGSLPFGLLAPPEDEWEWWLHSLPGPVLRLRSQLARSPDAVLAMSPAGWVAQVSLEPVTAESGTEPAIALRVRLYEPGGIRKADFSVPDRVAPGALLPPALSETWLAVPVRSPAGIAVHLVAPYPNDAPPGIRASLWLGGAERVALRLTSTHLTLADDRARLLVLDLESGHLLRNVRVSG